MNTKNKINKNKRFVIGDIHGAMRALEQCIERSGFDKKKDLLICLGDVCDGWPDVSSVFDYLGAINNLEYILGNHDYWALEWMETGHSEEVWLNQGGWATINSYKKGVPKSHIDILGNAKFFLELEDKLFVHGGFNPAVNITQQDRMEFLWDRTLVKNAMQKHHNNKQNRVSSYSEIYVGHTPTLSYHTNKPLKACGVFMMDTGAGWSGGKLTMMDIDSKKVFQSDLVDELYSEYPGRLKR